MYVKQQTRNGNPSTVEGKSINKRQQHQGRGDTHPQHVGCGACFDPKKEPFEERVQLSGKKDIFSSPSVLG